MRCRATVNLITKTRGFWYISPNLLQTCQLSVKQSVGVSRIRSGCPSNNGPSNNLQQVPSWNPNFAWMFRNLFNAQRVIFHARPMTFTHTSTWRSMPLKARRSKQLHGSMITGQKNARTLRMCKKQDNRVPVLPCHLKFLIIKTSFVIRIDLFGIWSAKCLLILQ